ncbi:ABC transporter substrate-binding protein [Rhizobium sp. G21]|uniref:ABC transporter substrate-binding protein n=1 Tax=Rhizobium sp. G21 TaxID=2758439 RepID=UPI001FF00148|nr:extracellular solute-binding protein [Rhizobium sp. G21]
MTLFKQSVSRRSFLRTTATVGLAAGAAGLKLPAFAQSNLPDIQATLDKISVDGYVREDYRKLYKLSSDPLWDPAKDWIRTVDWEKVRSEQSGKTVRFAIGAADQDSAAEGLKPFEALSGIKVELVPIPDDSFYDKAVAEFVSGNASFDALQFFSPWLGDFAAPGFLAELDDYAAKWKLPLDDFYDTYRLNYGYFGGKLVGIPFDCDIQMVHLRKSIVEKILGGPIDKSKSVASYDELIRISGEANKLGGGVAGLGMMLARGFWSTYTWEHIGAQAGLKLFDEQWNPQLASDAGMKAMDIIMALQKNAIEGTSGAGWGENRAAWLGGQVATNISWQDSGTQAMRPDQSKIVDDFVTIYEPRIEGGVFAPPNSGLDFLRRRHLAEPGGRLPDARLPHHLLDHGDERSQRQRRRPRLSFGARQRKAARHIAADGSLGQQPRTRLVRPAPARHVRNGAGARQRDQPRRHRPDFRQGSARKRPGRLEEDHGEERLFGRQGAGRLRGCRARHVCRRRQAAAVLRR